MPAPDDTTEQIRDEIHREGDAPRRTHLANERTYLAWWRSGLTSMAVGFGVGKFGPTVGDGADPQWAYVTLGAGFVLLGGAFVLYGLSRREAIDRALAEGRRIPSDGPWFTAFTAMTTVLGLGLLVLLIASS